MNNMMNPRELIMSEIEMLYSVLGEQVEMASMHQGPVPVIELDLMKQTIRNFYQQLHDLGKFQEKQFNIQPDEAIKIPVTTIVKEVNPIIQTIPEATQPVEVVVPENGSTSHESIIEEKVEEIVASNEEVEQPLVINESHKVKEEEHINVRRSLVKEPVREKSHATLFDVEETVGKQFTHQESIYDRLTKENHITTIAETIADRPLEDLQKSIGINERFAFINELFKGDREAYQEFLQLLNACHTQEEASAVLDNHYAVIYEWDPQMPAFIKLHQLIRRRWS